LQYLLGHQAVGVPTLRNRDPELGPAAEQFVLERATVKGNPDGGAICATQGFGGYNGAVAFRGANAEAFKRYQIDPKILAAYLERWPEIRRERERNERYWRLRRRGTIELAELHRWQGAE
jgi:cytochrome P450